MYFAYYSCVALFLLLIYLKLVAKHVQQQDYNTISICQDEEQKGRDLNWCIIPVWRDSRKSCYTFMFSHFDFNPIQSKKQMP